MFFCTFILSLSYHTHYQVIEDTGSTIIAMHHDDPEHQLHLPRYTPDMEPNADMIAIWRKWVGVLENSGGLQRLIKFVKTIPGFRELDMTDQIQLIKREYSIYESLCPRFLVAHNQR